MSDCSFECGYLLLHIDFRRARLEAVGHGDFEELLLLLGEERLLSGSGVLLGWRGGGRVGNWGRVFGRHRGDRLYRSAGLGWLGCDPFVPQIPNPTVPRRPT